MTQGDLAQVVRQHIGCEVRDLMAVYAKDPGLDMGQVSFAILDGLGRAVADYAHSASCNVPFSPDGLAQWSARRITSLVQAIATEGSA